MSLVLGDTLERSGVVLCSTRPMIFPVLVTAQVRTVPVPASRWHTHYPNSVCQDWFLGGLSSISCALTKTKQNLRRNLLCLRVLEHAATVVRTLCPGSRSLYWESVGEDGSPLPDQPGRERKNERLREGAGKVGRGKEGKEEEKRETSRTRTWCDPQPARPQLPKVPQPPLIRTHQLGTKQSKP